ncbi:MAG: mechanosensitive ion channel [Flavobacteriales bacterium]|nr:mechanosensitive ion channel [Flavobacteriales bacterium]
MAYPQNNENTNASLDTSWSISDIDLSQIASDYGIPLLKAVVVLIVGLWVIKLLTKLVRRSMNKSSFDESLKRFLISIVSNLLKVLLLISVLGMLGVEMTSFIALIGAAGLAIGVALSGTLQNFAGGVMLLIFKPFKLGDLITAQGHTGVVKEIQVFVTTLLSPDNKTILIPNGPLSNGDITNFTTEGTIRVDLTVGIGYGENIKAARAALIKTMEDHPRVLDDPAPFVGVSELGDSSVNLAVRPHCRPEHYWDVYFDIYEQGKEALDNAGIEIPFPQLDLHQK